MRKISIIEGVKRKLKYPLIFLGYGKKPDFLILGAQKAGTSALHQMLSKHNSLFGTNPKELHYFNRKSLGNKLERIQYQSYFPLNIPLTKDKLCFESTPDYLALQNVPERLYKHNSKLKFIVLLRDPTDRAYSAWKMWNNSSSDLRDNRTFEEAIEFEMNKLNGTKYAEDIREIRIYGYLYRGLYAEQIKRYFKLFSRDNFIFIENNDLLNQTNRTLEEISFFLGIEHIPTELIRANVGVSKSDIPSDIDEILRYYFRPKNDELFNLIGKSFDWK